MNIVQKKCRWIRNSTRNSVEFVVTIFSIAEQCTHANHRDDLMKVFCHDHTRNLDGIHPPLFCERCQAVLDREVTSTSKDEVYLHSVRVHEWSGHSELNCHVCKSLKKGGRSKKVTKNRGRPTAGSTHTHLKQIKSCKQDSYIPSQIERSTPIPTSLGVKQSDLECPLCMLLLDRPVQSSGHRTHEHREAGSSYAG